MANDQESRGGPEDLGQDPFVERLRPDPSQPPEAVRILEGLLGDSDREGYKRLYFNRELDHYAEFRTEDVVFSEPIPSEQPPFLGQQATRVGLRREATIEYTRLRTPRPVDEFDLDVRLGAPRGLRPEPEADPLTLHTEAGCTCPPRPGFPRPTGRDFGNTCPGWGGCPRTMNTCRGAGCCFGGHGGETRRWTCDGSTCGFACTAGCP